MARGRGSLLHAPRARLPRRPRSGRGRRPSRAALSLGRQPFAAEEKRVQRAALQEASGTVPRTHPAFAAVELLRRPRGIDARRARRAGGMGVVGVDRLRRMAWLHDRVLRPAPSRHLASPVASRGDGGDLRADPAPLHLLAPPRGPALRRLLFLTASNPWRSAERICRERLRGVPPKWKRKAHATQPRKPNVSFDGNATISELSLLRDGSERQRAGFAHLADVLRDAHRAE